MEWVFIVFVALLFLLFKIGVIRMIADKPQRWQKKHDAIFVLLENELVRSDYGFRDIEGEIVSKDGAIRGTLVQESGFRGLNVIEHGLIQIKSHKISKHYVEYLFDFHGDQGLTKSGSMFVPN